MAKYPLILLYCLLSFVSNAQDYKMEGNELVLAQAIHFKKGTSILTDEDKKALVTIKSFLLEKKYISTIRVEGHVSNDNPNAQRLSEQRAMVIAQWLIKEGIECTRIVAVGFGNTKPVAESSATSLNTRINFVIAALRNRLIGGMPADGGGKLAGNPCADEG